MNNKGQFSFGEIDMTALLFAVMGAIISLLVLKYGRVEVSVLIWILTPIATAVTSYITATIIFNR